MKILILGATGFIGSAVAQKLASQGHDITGLGRNLAAARRRCPRVRWIDGDLRNFKAPADWRELIEGIDAVVNCAGALQDAPRDDVASVQDRAMQALYHAAARRSGLRIVQISAARSLAGSNTVFMDSKMRADSALARSGIDHVIIRPAMVLGRNAHGGSALIRALAAMPFVVPLAYPDSPVETVSLDRLAGVVAKAIDGELANGADIDLIDSRCTLRSLVAANREWLGLPPATVVAIPSAVAAATSKLADVAGRLGWRSPLRSTAMIIAKSGIAAGGAASVEGNPLPPDMSGNPSAVQDLWFARLYSIKTLIILTLSMFWTCSGLVPLLNPGAAAARFGGSLAPSAAMAVTVITSIADIALGMAVLWRSYARSALIGMMGLSLAYLVAGSLIEPSLWLDPLGPLVKVLPSIVLALTGLAILEER